MTDKNLQKIFGQFGVKKFAAAGEPFDPTMHDALFQIPDSSKPAGTIGRLNLPLFTDPPSHPFKQWTMNSCRSGLEARIQAERSRHPSGAGRNRRPSRRIGVNRSGSCGSTLVSSPRQDSASNFRCFAVLITIMIVGTVVLFLLRSVSTWTRLKVDQRKKN